MSSAFEARLKAQAFGLGFDLAGIATLGPMETASTYTDWIRAGHHGEMHYLERGAELRADSTRPEPGMRSALVVGLDYGGRRPSGPVARYARGDDYHRVMWDRLETLLGWVQLERGAEVRGRAYVDTGPVLERDLARRAGLGWFGKNSMLINPERGSFFFIGSLFLDLDLAPDAPFASEHCGSCTRCIEACPTAAIVADGVIDATHCLSYLTIELKGAVPIPLRAALAEQLYGCDVCQDVCPWNVKFSSALAEPAFAARRGLEATTHSDARELARAWLTMDDAEYHDRFRGSAMTRAKRRGLARNAAVVLGTIGEDADIPTLERATSDAEPVVAEAAAWALAQLRQRSSH